ncbi:TatD family hydrolase [Clostridium sp. AL.422]|uniref:TatD family hydrolase n=1 Tax=Clostridium TaxID=1485 RepID=UPI00293DD40D|nr:MULTISPECIES: TatD family hydrolase [unclassified Clostridium]MDV4151529.1 TatD family hydrolase [Clostridium sp. AL.422]
MYIDCHTHLDFFEDNIEEAIRNVNDNKILTLANSIDIESYMKNKEYSKKSIFIKPCFGIHPWKAAEYKGDLQELIPYIEESEFIGEIGLDYLWVEDKTTFEPQRKVFYFILEESIKRNKVVSLHTKDAEEEVYEALKKYNYNRAIIHWYSGDISTLQKFIDLGCYFTISVDIGYSEKTYEVLSKIPMDKLLLETDGPTALEWVNGEYGYPGEIKNVYEKVAKYKNINIKDLLSTVEENLKRLLRIKENIDDNNY